MECNAGALAAVLARAIGFIPKMTPMDILKCFRFSGKTIQASSLNLGTMLHLPDGIDFPNEVCVGAATIASVASKLSETAIVSITDKALMLKDKTSSFKLPIMKSDQYPDFPECKAEFVKAPMLHHAVKAVSPFTMDPLSGKVFSGVRLVDDIVVATDYKCLAIATIGASTGITDTLSPGLVEHFRDDLDAELAIQAGRAFIKSSAGITYGSTLEGEFVDHNSFLKQWKYTNKFMVKREDLAQVFPKVTIMCQDRDVRWAFCSIKSNKLTIEVTSDLGNAVIEVPALGKGEARFRINVQMIERWFKSVKEEDLSIECSNGVIQGTPVKFEGRTKVKDGQELTCIAHIMPMTINVPGEAEDGTKKG